MEIEVEFIQKKKKKSVLDCLECCYWFELSWDSWVLQNSTEILVFDHTSFASFFFFFFCGM